MVDNQGLPHAVSVTTANVTDRERVLNALVEHHTQLGRLKCLMVDGSYIGDPFALAVKLLFSATVEVTKRSELHESNRKSGIKMLQEIEKVLREMSTLLDHNVETSWARYIDKLRYRMNIEPDNAIIDIKVLFGGMGSLNDLVLSKDGKPLIHENNKLDELRKELYELCSPHNRMS